MGFTAADYTNEGITAPSNGPTVLADNDANGQAGYVMEPMAVVEGSVLPFDWTNQHGCGPNSNVDCELVVQMMCDEPAGNPVVRDGEQTGCNNNNDQCPPLNNNNAVTAATPQTQFGNHEPVQWYLNGRTRQRNKGLFLADQNINNDQTARKTRQNPNGGRSGTENEEERDYYPYWQATPFRDLAVMTSNTTRCALYEAETQNVKNKGECTNPAHNNQAACTGAGATWTEKGMWPEGTAPDLNCMAAPWTRDNHLGNAAGTNAADGEEAGDGAYAASYNVTFPKMLGTGQSANFDRCILRLRYNITTGDGVVTDVEGAATDLAAAGEQATQSSPFWDLDSTLNGDDASPVTGNPQTIVPAASGADGGAALKDGAGATRTLQMALNTDQTGRTFQDRTGVFHVRAMTEAEEDDCTDGTVLNVGVIGKRGNIVQSYPAVEHDFSPAAIEANTDDCIHFQLHMTDRDVNNGDNNGEGKDGTGRSNFVVQAAGTRTYPITKFNEQNFFNTPEEMEKWAFLEQEKIGGAGCQNENNIANNNNNNQQDERNCAVLNARGPYYDGGMKAMSTAGSWNFMSTRDNNFSNRSQKGNISVTARSVWMTVLWVLLALVVIAGVAGLVMTLHLSPAGVGAFLTSAAGKAKPSSTNASRPGGGGQWRPGAAEEMKPMPVAGGGGGMAI